MSLVIYVSTKTVIISKYNLEFRFSPPSAKLTNAAIETYKMLRQSEVLQTQSSRDQRDEVITLLKHYGTGLYQAIIPEHIRSQVYKSGGIFIYSLDREIIDLPWELLFDGSSFFALTQGIVRIHKAEEGRTISISSKPLQALKVSLNSFHPLEDKKPSSNFISYVEDLHLNSIPKSILVDAHFDGNSSRASIIENLEKEPDIFLFSGYSDELGWTLSDAGKDEKQSNWAKNILQPKLKEAVQNGLRILILQSSSFLEKSSAFHYDPIRSYFDSDIPCVLGIHGRVTRKRLNQYLNVFLYSLIREESILRAHRLAINHIQSSLPLSWDWSWIRLHLNQQLLGSATDQPLPPFHFDRSHVEDETKKEHLTSRLNYFYNRRFSGCFDDYSRFRETIVEQKSKSVICINCNESLLVEDYILEYFRRLSATEDLSLSLLYYQKWGFSNTIKSRIGSTKYSNLFSFLLNEDLQLRAFDDSLFEISKSGNYKKAQKFLIVLTPPSKTDSLLDQWLNHKLESGWTVLCITEVSFSTSLKTQVLTLNNVSISQIFRNFEDELPESWIDLLENRVPPCMKDLRLLKIIQRFEDETLIASLHQNPSIDYLYENTISTIINSLTANRLKIFVALYLLHSIISRELLTKLIDEKNIDGDLEYLLHLHLIDADLSFKHFWIPSHLRYQLSRLHLIPETSKRNLGQEILQKIIVILDDSSNDLQRIEIGFIYCLFELIDLGIFENPLQRNLQFGKKLAKKACGSFNFLQNINISLELSLHIQKGQLIQKTLFSLIEILDQLPFGDETIKICEWLLQIETKHRNWQLVSEIQARIASIYIRLNKKEKAIGLISSAAKLNNDIKNYSSRYQNLIAIAMLLLDLEEFDRLMKLLANADFDISLLNKEDLTKLWLIDGHMLFNNNKYKEAQVSFEKVLKDPNVEISNSLLVKTLLNLAHIYLRQNNKKQYVECLENSVPFIEESREMEKASEIHEILYNENLKLNNLSKAVKHLEWIYSYNLKAENTNQVKELADKLGGLYFKIGEHSKSTDFYSIAQGI
ncbi:hypothetical protein KJ966_27350 [bacterium]|nr:hypothetical protein [bacterium]